VCFLSAMRDGSGESPHFSQNQGEMGHPAYSRFLTESLTRFGMTSRIFQTSDNDGVLEASRER